MSKRHVEPVLQRFSEQQTVLFPALSLRAFAAFVPTFPGYLEQHKLTIIEVARAAGLPAITVWCVERGQTVSSARALQVRQGVYRLTGVHYPGPINTTK
ncbi:MAG: hypothetical protein ACRDHW_12010 [Ktedonobacteraceae bacterium]